MDRGPIHLALVAPPPGVTAVDLDYATPLGTAAAVSARIADVLPGTTFGARGRGAFRRASYEIAFTLDGEEPRRIEVEINGIAGLAALTRLVEKTGWQAVDTGAGSVIDLDATRRAGIVVPVVETARSDRPSGEPGAPGSWRRRVFQGAWLVLFTGALWTGWAWSRRIPEISTPRWPASASEALSAVSAAQAAATPSGARANSRATAQALGQQLVRSASNGRNRMIYAKLLAPEFRGDHVAQQLLDFYLASMVFPGSLGEEGFLPPERLSDPRLFVELGMAPRLPSSFANAQRDGYEFRFDGLDCGLRPKYLLQLGALCGGFVYSARPLRASKTDSVSYALFSADERIHYRRDGALPTRTDPTVDNTAPSSAADFPGAGIPPSPGRSTYATSVLQKVIDAIYRAAGFGGTEGATVALLESNALADLRQVSAAEQTFLAMSARGFASPERLADPDRFAPSTMYGPPLLSAYFVQPLRQGYKFEFVGERPMAIGAPSVPLGPFYESFVYSATPVEPGPPGRRAFALSSNGQIYVTSEHRAATSRDTPLSRSGR
jgi:hypothetical protein